MPEFDPYLTWLGIPPTQRPPTYYQLLGVDTAITDPEVVKALALQRIAYVRNFQRGVHGELCARILEELAEAERILGDAARRAEYDRTLSPAPVRVHSKSPTQKPAPTKAAVARIDDEPIRRPRGRTRRRSEFNPFVALVGTVTAAVVLGVLITVASRLRRSEGDASPNRSEAGVLATSEPTQAPVRAATESKPNPLQAIRPSQIRVDPESAVVRVAKGAGSLTKNGGGYVVNATIEAYRNGIELAVSADGFQTKTVAIEPPLSESTNRTLNIVLEADAWGVPNSPTVTPEDRVFVKYLVTSSHAVVAISRGNARLIQIPRSTGLELIIVASRKEIEDGVELKIMFPELSSNSRGFRYLIHPDQNGNKRRRLIYTKKSEGWWFDDPED